MCCEKTVSAFSGKIVFCNSGVSTPLRAIVKSLPRVVSRYCLLQERHSKENEGLALRRFRPCFLTFRLILAKQTLMNNAAYGSDFHGVGGQQRCETRFGNKDLLFVCCRAGKKLEKGSANAGGATFSKIPILFPEAPVLKTPAPFP